MMMMIVMTDDNGDKGSDNEDGEDDGDHDSDGDGGDDHDDNGATETEIVTSFAPVYANTSSECKHTCKYSQFSSMHAYTHR